MFFLFSKLTSVELMDYKQEPILELINNETFSFANRLWECNPKSGIIEISSVETKGQRSTSPGDVILYDDRLWFCAVELPIIYPLNTKKSNIS